MNDQKMQDPGALFAHKKMNKCTLGARLQTLRSVENISQDRLAKKTHIRVEYVKALEEGRFDDLPAPVYVHGFLRVIAVVLSTRSEQLITLYDREIGIKENTDKKESIKTTVATGPRASKIHLYQAFLTPRQVFSAASIALAFGGIFYLYTVLHSFVGAPFVVIATPMDGITVEMAEVSVKGTTDPAAVLFIGGEDVIVGQDGHFETQVFLREGVNDIVIRSTNRFDKTTEKIFSVRYVNPHPQPKIQQIPITTSERLILFVRIETARTWLDISVDDEAVLTKTVDAGFEQIFEGDEIVITSGDGARTMVSRDGEIFVPLADVPGLAKDVRFMHNTSAQTNKFSNEQ